MLGAWSPAKPGLQVASAWDRMAPIVGDLARTPTESGTIGAQGLAVLWLFCRLFLALKMPGLPLLR